MVHRLLTNAAAAAAAVVLHVYVLVLQLLQTVDLLLKLHLRTVSVCFVIVIY